MIRCAAIVTGGIGDNILNFGLLNALRAKLGKVDFYTDQPETYQFYYGESPKGGSLEFLGRGMDSGIMINSFASVINGPIYMGKYLGAFLLPKDGPILDIYKTNQNFIREYKMEGWLKIHPFEDGVAAQEMSEKGFKRWTLPAEMLGFKDVPFIQHRPNPISYMILGDYITVHDGVGIYHAGKVTRATKTWDMTHWKKLISQIRTVWSGKIVQIGSATSRKIEGVDFMFIGELKDSFKLLAHSRLHIDGDSGMVHAARSFGVKSIVMFGPTPANYFGYPENVNLESQVCNPCFWSTDTWLAKCPKNYTSPICMNAILPSTVFQAVKKELCVNS